MTKGTKDQYGGRNRLSILSAKEYAKGMTVTIQASGKLGFSANSARVLRLQKGEGVKFAMMDGKELVLINSRKKEPDAFTLMQSNGYYSLKTKHLFDHLGMDYARQKISFDLVRLPDDGMELYRMVEKKKDRCQSRSDKIVESDSPVMR